MKILEAKTTEIIQFKFGGIVVVEIIGKKALSTSNFKQAFNWFIRSPGSYKCSFCFVCKKFNLEWNKWFAPLLHQFFQMFQLSLYLWVVRWLQIFRLLLKELEAAVDKCYAQTLQSIR